MDELEDTNREAVLVYLDGAREALQTAQYNLDGDFVTDYEMLGQADSDQAQDIVDKANHFVERCKTYLATERYL